MFVLMQVQTDYELIEEKYDQLLNYFNEKKVQKLTFIFVVCVHVLIPLSVISMK